MIVLDTHAFLWWAAGSSKLSKRARRAIDEVDDVGVCAISCWELAMLVEKGRLTLDRDVDVWLRAALAIPRVVLLPLSPDAAVLAARLHDVGSDPADRMIVATARLERSELVTRDARLRRSRSVATVW